MSNKKGANSQDAPRLFTYSHVVFYPPKKWFGPPNRYHGISQFTAPFILNPLQMY